MTHLKIMSMKNPLTPAGIEPATSKAREHMYSNYSSKDR